MLNKMDEKLLNETLKKIVDAHSSLRDYGVIRSKLLVGDLGEYYCEKLGLIDRDSNKVKKGFDGFDSDGKRVQVKTRTNPKNSAKIGFRNLEFDYCLYAELDDYYQLTSIRKVTRTMIKKNLNKAKDGISVGNLKKLNSEIVYGE